MTRTHVLTFLSDSERQLIVALLEERLGTLSETLERTDNTGEMTPIRDQIKGTVTLLDNLHRTSAAGHGVPTSLELKRMQ